MLERDWRLLMLQKGHRRVSACGGHEAKGAYLKYSCTLATSSGVTRGYCGVAHEPRRHPLARYSTSKFGFA
jgi:hypothetical protein